MTDTTPDYATILAKLAALEARALKDDAAAKVRGGDSTFADGPVAPRYFVWKERIAHFSPEQFAMVNALWNAPDRRMLGAELAEAVFGDELRPLRNVQRGVNEVFRLPTVAIRFTISRCGEYWVLE